MTFDNADFRRLHKHMFDPVNIPNWIVVIYESRRRFDGEVATRMIAGLVKACEAVGRDMNVISTIATRANPS
jgi:hypothetical protein